MGAIAGIVGLKIHYPRDREAVESGGQAAERLLDSKRLAAQSFRLRAEHLSPA